MRDNPQALTWIFLFVALASAIAVIIAALISNSNLQLPPTPTSMIQLPSVTITPTKVHAEIQPTLNLTLPFQKLSPSDYGRLLSEDSFDNDTGVWSLQKGSLIQNGMLILAPETFTVPNWDTKYSNFIFETKFQFFDPSQTEYAGISVYLREAWCLSATSKCSNQVGVSANGEVLAWRLNGSDVEQIMASTSASDFSINGANKLTVIVNESEFRIFINDVFVRAFSDSTYQHQSGNVVLDVVRTSVALDYVRIYTIP